MEDKIIKITEDQGEMTVTLKNGIKSKVLAKTIDTYWESGRKDCKIIILHPIDLSTQLVEKNKEK